MDIRQKKLRRFIGLETQQGTGFVELEDGSYASFNSIYLIMTFLEKDFTQATISSVEPEEIVKTMIANPLWKNMDLPAISWEEIVEILQKGTYAFMSSMIHLYATMAQKENKILISSRNNRYTGINTV